MPQRYCTRAIAYGNEKLGVAGSQTEYWTGITSWRAFALDYAIIPFERALSNQGSPLSMAEQIIEYHNLVLVGRFATFKSGKRIELGRLIPGSKFLKP